MTALIVIAAVLALLAVVAFLRVRVTAGFAQYPFLYYRIGPITIPLVDKDWISEDLTDHTKRDKWQEKRRRQLENEKKKKKGPEVPAYSGKDLKKMAVVIRDLVAGVLRYVRKYACIETLRIRLLAASDDAMKTGVLYGEMQALLAAVRTLLDEIPEKRIKEEGIRLEAECDFLADRIEADAEICVTMRVWQALVTRNWYTEEIKKLWELMIKEPKQQ